MKKYAGLENSDITDPKTGKKIFVSTTVRLMYRKAWPDNFLKMRNVKLNVQIAKDFSISSDKIVHYFWLNKEARIIAEIRVSPSGYFFISVIKDSEVNILAIQTSWLKPKFKPTETVIELGDE